MRILSAPILKENSSVTHTNPDRKTLAVCICQMQGLLFSIQLKSEVPSSDLLLTWL